MKIKQTLLVCIGIIFPLWSYTYTSSYTQNASYQSETIIPFRLVKRMIVIRAYMDGQKGNFIVDTGTKAVIINEAYKVGHTVSNLQVVDFSGRRMSFKENIITFSWQRIGGKKFKARIGDLSKLEEIMGIPIMGYIGYEVLEEYEVLFDYQQRQMHLFELNRRGEWVENSFLKDERIDSITLMRNDFMPFVKVQLGDEVLKFGIDSGASIGLIRKGSLKKMNPYFRELPPRMMAGFEGHIKQANAGIITHIHIDEKPFPPMNCIVESMVDVNTLLPNRLDGLLGFEFLSQVKMSLNYKKGMLYIWKRQDLQRIILTEIDY